MNPTAMGDRELLRAFKEQQARLRAADDAVKAAPPWEWRKVSMLRAAADAEHDTLRPFALEMRRRVDERVARDIAGLDDEWRALVQGDG